MNLEVWLATMVESTLFVGLSSLLLARGQRLYRSGLREAELLAARQKVLTPYLVEGGEPPHGGELNRQQRIELVLRLSASLKGEVRQRIQHLAGHWGLLEEEQRALGSRQWWRRLGALRFFSALGQVPEGLEARLHDPHPLVRAEAIYMVPLEPNAERVERVVEELFHPASPARFASQSVLRDLSSLALEPLQAWLTEPPEDTPSLDVALRTACAIAAPELRPAALQHSHHPGPEVQAAACQLLGAIGGEASEVRLVEMLDGALPDAVRAAAAEALGHLSHWPAGPALARLLGEPDWTLRYQAAQALRALGPPGLLFLRQIAEQQEHAGASLARLVLAQC